MQHSCIPIEASEIEMHLSRESRAFYRISVENELVSTNTALKTIAQDGAPAGTVLIARRQSGGRGRLGRTFHSPAGTGLYMSVLVRPTLKAEQALYLTTCTAVACAKAIDQIRNHALYDSTCNRRVQSGQNSATDSTSASAKIKWVNDIYLEDASHTPKKVCGILTEAALCPSCDRLAYAVIGIGVNLLPPTEAAESLSSIAGGLFAYGQEAYADGNRLAAYILNALLPALDNPLDPRFADDYRKRSLLDGKMVRVRPASSLGGEEIPARVLCIDDTMGLCVKYEDGRTAVLRSGEIVMNNDTTIQAASDSVHLL